MEVPPAAAGDSLQPRDSDTAGPAGLVSLQHRHGPDAGRTLDHPAAPFAPKGRGP